MYYSNEKAVKSVREVLYGESMRNLLQEVTGIKVNEVMDMSAAVTATAMHTAAHSCIGVSSRQSLAMP